MERSVAEGKLLQELRVALLGSLLHMVADRRDLDLILDA